MEEVQNYHPLALAVKEVCQKVHQNPLAKDENVLGHTVPLTLIMMLFTGGNPRNFFSREFLAVLETEKEIFNTEHEFSAGNLVMALDAEAKRILEID